MNQILPLTREGVVAPAPLQDANHDYDPLQPVPNPLPKLLSGEDLPIEDSEHLFERLVLGKLEPAEIAGMLIALRMKGETAEELIGAARRSVPLRCLSTGPITSMPTAAAPAGMAPA